VLVDSMLEVEVPSGESPPLPLGGDRRSEPDSTSQRRFRLGTRLGGDRTVVRRQEMTHDP
jgi:hypothetical protein